MTSRVQTIVGQDVLVRLTTILALECLARRSDRRELLARCIRYHLGIEHAAISIIEENGQWIAVVEERA